MQITKEFLEAEIAELKQEMGKAQTFLTQAQATIASYQMLINRLDQPEPEPEQEHGDANKRTCEPSSYNQRRDK